ncbi:nucleotide-binding protein [Archaeoglobus veneficus]|uniref:Nucleic acid-binding protein contains PIN domain-like protein n=1 Tax=Archaeoglobus veneficus (strain DSM 11195 / SNP6) TaxID=693661 RepID=F2KPZ8_ARCVS|nr:nucleotide-binding protein [Archaeoglobus veneficus]AEA46505.1 nucleic acid-binding protein contains PIN domain-like protein [Archaeoglobus veneficus SNP6]
MAVADSSPLIYLAKVEKLRLLRELYGSLKVPEAVYREVVVKGEEKGFEDALRVKNEIGRFLSVHKPREETMYDIRGHLKKLGFQLGRGEIECIALCLDANDRFLLSDDEDAKRFARIYRIECKGTIYILLKSYKVGLLSRKECAETFERIVEKGFWVDAGVVNLFHKTLERLSSD